MLVLYLIHGFLQKVYGELLRHMQGHKMLSSYQHDVINGVKICGASFGITGPYPDLTAFMN